MNVELTQGDWRALLGYLQRADDVRSLLAKTKEAGKQQISINASEIKEWMEEGVPADVWVKIGVIMMSAEVTKGRE